jgi:hypothetical protein
LRRRRSLAQKLSRSCSRWEARHVRAPQRVECPLTNASAIYSKHSKVYGSTVAAGKSFVRYSIFYRHQTSGQLSTRYFLCRMPRRHTKRWRNPSVWQNYPANICLDSTKPAVPIKYSSCCFRFPGDLPAALIIKVRGTILRVL